MATGGKVANVFILFLGNLELLDDTADLQLPTAT